MSSSVAAAPPLHFEFVRYPCPVVTQSPRLRRSQRPVPNPTFRPLLTGLALSAAALTAWACAGPPPQAERWTDPEIFAMGRERPHATYTPFQDRETALTNDATASTRVLSLNGAWRFAWVQRPADAPSGFEHPPFDDSGWDSLEVPSSWERSGYGIPYYVDAGMPPSPAVTLDSNDNPVGSYRRTFTLPESWRGQQVFLHFASVGSAATVWVNGAEAGYSQGSKISTFPICRRSE